MAGTLIPAGVKNEAEYNIISQTNYYGLSTNILTDGLNPSGASVYFYNFNMEIELKSKSKIWVLAPTSYLTYGDGKTVEIRKEINGVYTFIKQSNPQPVQKQVGWFLLDELDEGKYRLITPTNNSVLIAELYVEKSPVNKILTSSSDGKIFSLDNKGSITSIPSSSERNFIDYGLSSQELNFEHLLLRKNYVLQGTDAHKELNRKPLSINLF